MVRLPKNFTARRNVAAPCSGKGRRPRYGERIRPLARTHKDKTLPAPPPDREVCWQEDGRVLQAAIWDDLILPGVVPDPANATFSVYAITDPRYTEPWLLGSPLPIQAVTVKAMYQDRWPVE